MENVRGGNIILLCVGGNEPAMDWELVSSLHNVVTVADWRWAAASLETGVRHLDRDVHSVIFDQSIDPSQFLDFLATLPYEFRGDILFVERENRGFLSSCTPRDGRILYRLGQTDIDFYIQAKLGSASSAWEQQAALAQ